MVQFLNKAKMTLFTNTILKQTDLCCLSSAEALLPGWIEEVQKLNVHLEALKNHASDTNCSQMQVRDNLD